MSRRDHVRDARNAMLLAGVIIVGVALAVETRYFLPHDPIAAFLKVLGAALVATAIMLRLSRQRRKR